MDHKTFNIRALSHWVEEWETGGPAARLVLSYVMSEGILKAVRKQYLSRVERAQKIEFAKASKASGASAMVTRQRAIRLQRARAAQAAAVERGNLGELEDAQSRIEDVLNEINEQSSKANASERRSTGTLAAISSGLFRQRQAQVLMLLTGKPEYARIATTLRAGAGNLSDLEQVRTPSALQWLRGVEVASPLSTFWKQLEFGTGKYRINEDMNPFTPGRGSQSTRMISMNQLRAERKGKYEPVSWYFGALGMFGSQPMGFLYANGMQELYRAAAEAVLAEAFEKNAPSPQFLNSLL